MPDEKMYTEEEVEHKVAREVASREISHLRTTVEYIQTTHSEQYTKIDGTLDALFKRLDTNAIDNMKNMDSCKDSMMEEVHRDFVGKTEFIEKMMHLENKFDKQWIKVTTAVSVAGTIIILLAKMAGFI